MAATAKQAVSTEHAPAAIGPYAQAIRIPGLIFSSGQIPVDPATKQVAGESIQDQARQVMKNLDAVLRAGGSSLDRVVKTTCFLADLDDFAAFNEIYGSYFADGVPPARSTVQVARLPLGVRVEVECVALTD